MKSNPVVHFEICVQDMNRAKAFYETVLGIKLEKMPAPTAESGATKERHFPLPNLDVGDLIIGPLMGAYTSATATEFNFVPKTQIVPINCPEAIFPSMSRIA